MADFKKRVGDLTVDAFHGMGTNMTAGLTYAQQVFIEDGMTQADRDEFGTNTNEVEKFQNLKFLLLKLDGKSADSLLERPL